MDTATCGWISIPVMLLLLLTGIPVAYILAFVGFLGCWFVVGFDKTMILMGTTFYAKVANYNFSVLPLFIMMTQLTFHAGFAKDCFDAAKKWFGGLSMGMAHATMIAYAIVSAASGNAIASCAALTRIVIPEFDRIGYDRKLGFGVMAAGATLDPLIPPSMLMVVYGIIAEVSIAKLLIAGVLPGLVACIVFMATIYVVGKLNPKLGPRLPSYSWRERLIAIKDIWSIFLLVVIVLGGIYTGIFTPTEAGAIGAFGALAIGLLAGHIRGKELRASLVDSARMAGAILLIIGSAFFFSVFLALTRLPTHVSAWLISLELHRMVILVGLFVFYIIVGMFLDMIAAMFITLPIILPGILALGFDPVWFGVIMIQLCGVALLTPPYGLNLFTIKTVLPEVPMMDIIRGVIPFIVAAIVSLLIFATFPQIALFLPNLMSN
ncbi:MAG: TRAP transporter large permease [Thermodesulfobacteriota bacterium]